MRETFLDGETAIVAVYLDKPQDGKPTGEAIDRSFFMCLEGSVTQLDRVVEEPYLIDWMDWRMMYAEEQTEHSVLYQDEWLHCEVELDILPVDVPKVVYAMLGRVMQTEFGDERAKGRQDGGNSPLQI